MGIRSKIKSRLKNKLEQLKVLAAVVQDEANHPGRPQPHMAARNPFWGGEEKVTKADAHDRAEGEDVPKTSSELNEELQDKSKKPQEPQKQSVGKDEQKGSLDEEEADFWFLKYGDNEGWNETNPGKKK